MHARIPRLRRPVIPRPAPSPAPRLRMWSPMGILHVGINVAALLLLFVASPLLDLFQRDED